MALLGSFPCVLATVSGIRLALGVTQRCLHFSFLSSCWHALVCRPHTLNSTSTSKSFQSTVTGELNAPYSKQFVHSKSSQYRKMKTEWKSNVYLARSRIQVGKTLFSGGRPRCVRRAAHGAGAGVTFPPSHSSVMRASVHASGELAGLVPPCLCSGACGEDRPKKFFQKELPFWRLCSGSFSPGRSLRDLAQAQLSAGQNGDMCLCSLHSPSSRPSHQRPRQHLPCELPAGTCSQVATQAAPPCSTPRPVCSAEDLPVSPLRPPQKPL